MSQSRGRWISYRSNRTRWSTSYHTPYIHLNARESECACCPAMAPCDASSCHILKLATSFTRLYQQDNILNGDICPCASVCSFVSVPSLGGTTRWDMSADHAECQHRGILLIWPGLLVDRESMEVGRPDNVYFYESSTQSGSHAMQAPKFPSKCQNRCEHPSIPNDIEPGAGEIVEGMRASPIGFAEWTYMESWLCPGIRQLLPTALTWLASARSTGLAGGIRRLGVISGEGAAMCRCRWQSCDGREAGRWVVRWWEHERV